MALSLSLLSGIILISTGALTFAHVSSGMLGSTYSSYLIKPVLATTDAFGDCIPSTPGGDTENPLPCVMADPGVPGGGLGDPWAEEIVVCAPPLVKEGNQCVQRDTNIFGDPGCMQGFNCPGDPGGPDTTLQPTGTGSPSDGGSSWPWPPVPPTEDPCPGGGTLDPLTQNCMVMTCSLNIDPWVTAGCATACGAGATAAGVPPSIVCPLPTTACTVVIGYDCELRPAEVQPEEVEISQPQ